MPDLFTPLQLGAITLPNRILMAPLTRSRTEHDHIPTPLMAEYYSQRASAGLIIAEATNPLFPALRSSPTAVQEPPAKSKFLAVLAVNQ